VWWMANRRSFTEPTSCFVRLQFRRGITKWSLSSIRRAIAAASGSVSRRSLVWSASVCWHCAERGRRGRGLAVAERRAEASVGATLVPAARGGGAQDPEQQDGRHVRPFRKE